MSTQNTPTNADFLKKITEKSPQNTQIPPTFVAFPAFSLENLAVLRQIQVQMQQNKGYLDSPQCPYAPDSKAFLFQIFSGATKNPEEIEAELNQFFGDDLMYDRIITDSKRAYMNLANQMTKMETGKNLEDAISFTKALTSMQERLLNVQEKAEGLKNIHEFKNKVLEVIAAQLTPDQRTGIIEALEKTIKE